MIRFKDIHIPKPCSVDYDFLPGNEIKRFCGSCEKHVYDFRGKDESYLNEVYQSTGKVCGIFDSFKINTTKIYKPFLFQFISSKVVAFILFFKTMTLSAENNKNETPIHILQSASDTIPTIKAIIKNKTDSQFPYRISIYIDGELYKSKAIITDDYLYLPVSITDDQKIKIIVHQRISFRNHTRIKQHKYTFKFRNAEKITVRVHFKKYLFILRKRGAKCVRQGQIMGLMRR